jgi:hypothetical protein
MLLITLQIYPNPVSMHAVLRKKAFLPVNGRTGGTGTGGIAQSRRVTLVLAHYILQEWMKRKPADWNPGAFRRLPPPASVQGFIFRAG